MISITKVFIIKKKGIVIIVLLIGTGITIGTLAFLLLNNGGIRYSHTIKIDGVNDFYATENFTTTSPSYYGYIAWDNDYMYFGMFGDDFASSFSSRWVLIYIGNGNTGTTTGLQYGTLQPNLPFSATHHIRWRLDLGDLNAYEWTGSWTNAGWDFTGDAYSNSTLQFFEIRIPLVDIGSPSTVSVHVSMIDESAPWTYAGVPSTSFSDGGTNLDYTKYYLFNLYGTITPTSYTPI